MTTLRCGFKRPSDPSLHSKYYFKPLNGKHYITISFRGNKSREKKSYCLLTWGNLQSLRKNVFQLHWNQIKIQEPSSSFSFYLLVCLNIPHYNPLHLKNYT